MTKLTLSMDESLVATARRLAKHHNTSISALLANYVKAMAALEGLLPDVPPTSVTARLTGVIAVPPDVTDDELLAAAILDEHELADR